MEHKPNSITYLGTLLIVFTFIGLMAFYVTPWALALVLFVTIKE